MMNKIIKKFSIQLAIALFLSISIFVENSFCAQGKLADCGKQLRQKVKEVLKAGSYAGEDPELFIWGAECTEENIQKLFGVNRDCIFTAWLADQCKDLNMQAFSDQEFLKNGNDAAFKSKYSTSHNKIVLQNMNEIIKTLLRNKNAYDLLKDKLHLTRLDVNNLMNAQDPLSQLIAHCFFNKQTINGVQGYIIPKCMIEWLCKQINDFLVSDRNPRAVVQYVSPAVRTTEQIAFGLMLCQIVSILHTNISYLNIVASSDLFEAMVIDGLFMLVWICIYINSAKIAKKFVK